jgi:hypothetical protein
MSREISSLVFFSLRELPDGNQPAVASSARTSFWEREYARKLGVVLGPL